MPNVKRITDLKVYKSVLPYDSELFGVYHSLIGWKSTRKINRIKSETGSEKDKILSRLGLFFENKMPISFNSDCGVSAPNLEPAGFVGPSLINQDSIVLQQISEKLQTLDKVPVDINAWRQILNNDILTQILRTNVIAHYNSMSVEGCKGSEREKIQETVKNGIDNEAVIAGVIKQLVDNGSLSVLNDIFFSKLGTNSSDAFMQAIAGLNIDFSDPYLTFDPKKDVKDVTLSPVGIVHLFRQYFFELDTFLGIPTSHVWLSPGSTVELIEVSTRKTTIEKTVETSTETTSKIESSKTEQDDLSEAVKQENKEDLKLGFTATVNQSWGTGSATATASLNKDTTQQLSRETNHKRMRQQSQKLSSEIRENFKSTFKTVTEDTETSSKRYVLTNNTGKLLNYELRRKMRQVAVQVQDIGSYLCWETFVDDPGEDLGLANLVHISKPADLLPLPDSTRIPYPPDQSIPCNAKVIWNFGDNRQFGDFIALTPPVDPPQAPEGYQVKIESGVLPAKQLSASGTDFSGIWPFGARFTSKGQIEIGLINTGGDWKWDKFVNFEVGTVLTYVATDNKKKEIDAANSKKMQDAQAANDENARKTKEAYITAVKDRVEMASGITKRNFEELRDEERIIVYRRLISSLMTENQYYNTDNSSRHVLSELINSIFDIDKMLYFVAPEYWKPRFDHRLKLYDLQEQLNDDLVPWSDNDPRPDNYLITEKSAPAQMGSSLGWLLQLDGDNQRNAFLNAPWVKAVIPIRPGKEQAALNWLQNVNVEGTDGLDAEYAAPSDELDQIRTGLGLVPGSAVTIKDAIEYLCIEVTEKNEESNKIKTYPETEINDNKVSSTPVEKVYEHGFYPLQGGFRVNPNDPNPDPNNKDKNFQVFDQWIEVLPTDQVVPVEVCYDPMTGRQLSSDECNR